jgi:hypothetical protein
MSATVTWDPPTTTFPYGTVFPSANFNAVGSPAGGSYLYLIQYPFGPNSQSITITSTTVLPAGTYNYVLVYYSVNIEFTYSPFIIFTVNKVTLNISVNDQTMIYKGTIPTLTSTITGFVNNDNVNSLTGSLSYVVTDSNGNVIPYNSLNTQNVGNYIITVSIGSLSSSNYTFNITRYSGTLRIVKTTPVLNNNPSPVYDYGTGLSQTSLNLTLSPNIPGTFTYQYTNSSGTIIPEGYVLNAGSYNIYQLFTPDNTDNYTTAYNTTPLIVRPLTLVLDNNPSPVYNYGTELTQITLNLTVSPNIPGTFTYRYDDSSGNSIPEGYVLNAGSYNIYQLFTPDDLINYTIANLTTPLTVEQLLTNLNNISPIQYNYGIGLTQTSLNLTVTPNIPGIFTYRYDDSSGNIIFENTILDTGIYIIYELFTPTNTNYATSNNTTNLTVDAIPLNVIADNKIMTYGDSVLPVLTVTYDGLIPQDIPPPPNLTDLTYIITNSNGDTIPYDNLSIENPGDYTISPSGLSSNNYNITYSTGKLIINKAIPTITYSFEKTSYFYGSTFGDINVPGAIVTFNSETLEGLTIYRQNSISGPILNNNQILSIANYNIYAIFTPKNNANFLPTSTYAPLSIIISEIYIYADNISMSYGQNPPPPLTFSYDGNFSGDISFLEEISKFSISDSSGKIIEYNNLPITDVGLYTITLTLINITFTEYVIILKKPTSNLTINQVDLYVTPENENMVYGSQPPTLTSIYNGFKNNQNYLFLEGTLVYQVTDSLLPPNIIPLEDLPKKNVGTYFITIIDSSLKSINYNIIIIPSSSNLIIDKNILYVSPDNKTITYGYSAPLFTSTYTGFLNGDTVSVVTGTLVYTFFDSKMNPINLNNVNILDTGIYNIVLNKNDVKSINYIIKILNKTAYFSIQQKLLFIFPQNKTMVYGSQPPPFTLDYEGFVNGNTPQSSLTGSVIYTIYDSKYNSINYKNLEIVKVGTYTIQLFLSTLSSNDYNIQITNYLAALVITKKQLTINVNSLSIVYGTPPVFTSSYVGFVNNDNPTRSLTGSLEYIVTDLLLNIISDNELSNLEVGSYYVNLFQGSLTSNNYEINIGINNAPFTVNKKLLKIYPDNKNISYGSKIPTLTSTYTGFIIGENPTYLTGNLIYIVTDSAGNIIDINDISSKIYDAGTYTITLLMGSLKSNNYNLVIQPNTSTLIITPLTPQIVYNLPIKSYNYDSSFPQENLNAYVTYNGTNITNKGSITYRLNNINGSILSSSTILNAGNYTVYAIFTSNDINYISVNTSNKFTVNKVTPTIIYSIPEQYTTMVYGNKFVKEQFDAYVTYNNKIVLAGIILYKLELSSTQIITTNDYPLITTKRIYAQFISNNINYNDTNTFDTINVVYSNNSNNNNGNNNNGNNNNGNNKLIKINTNGVLYYFNPVTKYYTKI